MTRKNETLHYNRDRNPLVSCCWFSLKIPCIFKNLICVESLQCEHLSSYLTVNAVGRVSAMRTVDRMILCVRILAAIMIICCLKNWNTSALCLVLGKYGEMEGLVSPVLVYYDFLRIRVPLRPISKSVSLKIIV